MFTAIAFGVPGVLYPSLQELFACYELDHDLTEGCLETARLANIDAWVELELGDRTLDEFLDEYAATCSRHGFFVEPNKIFGQELVPNLKMIQAADELRSNGKRTHVVTNSWLLEPGDPEPWNLDPFDIVIESATEGIRKPDERLYSLLCARSATPPDEIVVVDFDREALESASQLGMATVEVCGGDRLAALREISELFELQLT